MDNNDLPDDITLGSNVTDVTKEPELEFDYYLELARMWDEEDLTGPPHCHYDY